MHNCPLIQFDLALVLVPSLLLGTSIGELHLMKKNAICLQVEHLGALLMFGLYHLLVKAFVIASHQFEPLHKLYHLPSEWCHGTCIGITCTSLCWLQLFCYT